MSSGSDINYPPQEVEDAPRYIINGKIMVSAIICLLLVASLVFLLHVYARWIWRESARFSRRSRRRSASVRRRFSFTGQEPVRLLNVGLDSAILETLPVFLYKSQNFADGLDCAVCLCEFEENEKARLLPNCGHSFHTECIDMWFRSHSTCPVCRTGAKPEQPVLESARAEQVSVTIPGPISSGFQDNLNLEQEQTAGCGEDYNVQNPTNMFSWGWQKQRKTGADEGTSRGRASMPQIVIEIPKRTDGFSSGDGHPLQSPNGSQSSSKSPIPRLRSLSRILSRDTEKKVFPADHPPECRK